MLSSAVADSALSRGSSNRKSGWSTWTARSTTDPAWNVVSRFTGLQQHACFVAGPLALEHGRGERAAASPDQSQIWMADFDCAIAHRSSLACLSRFAGPQQLVCFVAGSLAFKRGRGECAIPRIEQSQICMVNLDCAINHRSSLACCVRIYGPAAACVLCS